MRARIVLPILLLIMAVVAAFVLQHLLTRDTLAREKRRQALGPDTLRLEAGGAHPHLQIPVRKPPVRER